MRSSRSADNDDPVPMYTDEQIAALAERQRRLLDRARELGWRAETLRIRQTNLQAELDRIREHEVEDEAERRRVRHILQAVDRDLKEIGES